MTRKWKVRVTYEGVREGETAADASTGLRAWVEHGSEGWEQRPIEMAVEVSLLPEDEPT